MSEFINNREMRQQVIKDILKQLHEGKSVEEVKKLFEEAFDGVSATEITDAETALMEGGLPVEEVQKLCDVHAAVFKGSIAEIHHPQDPAKIPGHPVHTLEAENRYLERIMEEEIKPNLVKAEKKEALLAGIEKLEKIALHYQRKENLFFPYMEKYGITAPPKVMWGVDDEIRAQIKEVKSLVVQNAPADVLLPKAEEALNKAAEMIFKEEKIMVPMLLEQLTQDEWESIGIESAELGYLIENVPVWKPDKTKKDEPKIEQEEPEVKEGIIKLPSGVFNLEELVCMLNTLPFDITFVDKNDEVKFFSEGKERTFPRTRAIIGRNVSNCHPPASVHIVENIVQDFKDGKKDQEDFWIKMGGKYVFIRYYAVRNEAGEYLGVLEVTQDIQPIQEITGEKRLVSE
ncbi:DUF438 domain-containing protein [Konateibacter massiliensis]|uniref:DUF438 domain-containing protein n=1 Tax=Konateibacter massiliensis TaxID=2002841 RepID=UPI000C158DC5|nr:DUF438 domain-containing protein [Konateibacter massiliensis]